jgi:hypothetical protein
VTGTSIPNGDITAELIRTGLINGVGTTVAIF